MINDFPIDDTNFVKSKLYNIVKIPLDRILKPDTFQVDENNFLGYSNYDASFTFEFFNTEPVLQKFLKIKLIK